MNDQQSREKYIESIKIWKESLVVEKEELQNSIVYRNKEVILAKKRVRFDEELLSACEDRIKEANEILEL